MTTDTKELEDQVRKLRELEDKLRDAHNAYRDCEKACDEAAASLNQKTGYCRLCLTGGNVVLLPKDQSKCKDCAIFALAS